GLEDDSARLLVVAGDGEDRRRQLHRIDPGRRPPRLLAAALARVLCVVVEPVAVAAQRHSAPVVRALAEAEIPFTWFIERAPHVSGLAARLARTTEARQRPQEGEVARVLYARFTLPQHLRHRSAVPAESARRC